MVELDTFFDLLFLADFLVEGEFLTEDLLFGGLSAILLFTEWDFDF